MLIQIKAATPRPKRSDVPAQQKSLPAPVPRPWQGLIRLGPRAANALARIVSLPQTDLEDAFSAAISLCTSESALAMSSRISNNSREVGGTVLELTWPTLRLSL